MIFLLPPRENRRMNILHSQFSTLVSITNTLQTNNTADCDVCVLFECWIFLLSPAPPRYTPPSPCSLTHEWPDDITATRPISASEMVEAGDRASTRVFILFLPYVIVGFLAFGLCGNFPFRLLRTYFWFTVCMIIILHLSYWFDGNQSRADFPPWGHHY